MVILDTSIIIDHIRRQDSPSIFTQLIKDIGKESLAISIITTQELYAGKSTRQTKQEEAVLTLINPLKILPYTYEIAKKAGEIQRDAPQTLETADAIIAATALLANYEVATLNLKDFLTIPSITLYSLLEYKNGI
jgi:predicted nucleic acid-binding protein